MRAVRMVSAAVAALALAGGARAAEYIDLVQSIDIARPPAEVMRRTDGFCDIGSWLRTTCVITSVVKDGPGAVRVLAGRVTEVMVARTQTGYTYAQPLAPDMYHGAIEYRPLDGGRSTRVVYSLFYDSSSLPEEGRAADKARRADRFKAVLAAMKAEAEAP